MNSTGQALLTDMHMPEMDGFDLIERMRCGPDAPAAAIMMGRSRTPRRDSQEHACRLLASMLE